MYFFGYESYISQGSNCLCGPHFLISWPDKMYLLICCISLIIKLIFLKDQIVCVLPISWLVGRAVKPPATSVPAKSQTGRLAKIKENWQKNQAPKILAKSQTGRLAKNKKIGKIGWKWCWEGILKSNIWDLLHPWPIPGFSPNRPFSYLPLSDSNQTN